MVFNVIIPTKNKANELFSCLESIGQQTSLPKKITVVENNNTKTLSYLVEVLQKKYGMKILYLLQRKKGIAATRNLGIEHAEGDTIVFVDDDCILDKRYFDILTKIMKQKEIVGVLGRSLNYFPNNKWANAEQKLHEAWFDQYLDFKKKCLLFSGMFINTRNFVIRRNILKKMDFWFDEKAPFKIEDTDFGLRLFKVINPITEKIIYSPELVIVHKNSTDGINFAKRRFHTRMGKNWLDLKYPFYDSVSMKNPDSIKNIYNTSAILRAYFNIEVTYFRVNKVINKLKVFSKKKH